MSKKRRLYLMTVLRFRTGCWFGLLELVHHLLSNPWISLNLLVEGIFVLVAILLNKVGKANGGRANSMKDVDLGNQFVYKHLGSMASVGSYKALVDLRHKKEAKGSSLAGFVSWFVWRSTYLTRVINWRNRFYVAINRATTFIFGRDKSRI